MKKVLVTGASGFLGRNLIKRIAEEHSYDLLAVGGHADSDSGIIPLDLTDADKTRQTIQSFAPDFVCHVGAVVDLTRSFDVARKVAQVNILGTINLLKALSEKPAHTFLFASTEEVYGDGLVPFREGNPTYPPSPYAVAKSTGEHLLRLYAGKAFTSGYSFRIGTMYGPHLPQSRFISLMIQKALKNEEIPLTSGTKKRDYVFVGDVVCAFLLALKRRSADALEVVNIGGGVSISLKDLAEKILELSGSSSMLRLGAIPDRIGESDTWLLDNTKAQELLGWKPATDISAGLVQTISFVKSSL